MGENVEKALRLGKESAGRRARELDVRSRGLNIFKDAFCTLEEYDVLLDRLLGCPEVVDIKNVKLYASHRFQVTEIGIFVDARAPIEKVLEFLRA